jgi:hypothetical protein
MFAGTKPRESGGTFILLVAAAAAFGAETVAAQPARAGDITYVDSSRAGAGVLEFLDVSRNGPRARVRFDRYLQDFSYCNGVAHRSDVHAGAVIGATMTLSERRTLRVSGDDVTVIEPGTRGPHHFRRLRDSAERKRLVHAFYTREAANRRSVKFQQHLAGAYSHCKKS